MGLHVYTIKPIEKLSDSTNYSEVSELYDKYENEGKDVIFLYNVKEFKEHLTEYAEGLYLYVYRTDGTDISMTYSYYNDLRNDIVNLVEKQDFDKGYFKEFYWFSDCEGCFDYKVAGKILEDFKKYLPKAKETFNEYDFDYYQKYMKILEECIEDKGVVMYK